jgi:hypothetical protein
VASIILIHTHGLRVKNKSQERKNKIVVYYAHTAQVDIKACGL